MDNHKKLCFILISAQTRDIFYEPTGGSVLYPLSVRCSVPCVVCLVSCCVPCAMCRVPCAVCRVHAVSCRVVCVSECMSCAKLIGAAHLLK